MLWIVLLLTSRRVSKQLLLNYLLHARAVALIVRVRMEHRVVDVLLLKLCLDLVAVVLVDGDAQVALHELGVAEGSLGD